MADRRNRTTIILLLILALIIISSYYNTRGARLINSLQRLTTAALTPAYKAVNAVVSPLKHGWIYIISFKNINKSNYRLVRLNTHLKQQVGEVRRLRRENRRLRKLLGFKKNLKYKTIPAMVIGRSPNSWQSILVIDKGRRDGLKKYQAALTDRGVVGRVALVGDNFAKIMLLNDSKSAVSVEIERTADLGIVEGDSNGILHLKYLPHDADLKVGDRLLTSGAGQVFPRGLPVGVVTKIKAENYGLEKNAVVKSAADLKRVEVVLIVAGNGERPNSGGEDGR